MSDPDTEEVEVFIEKESEKAYLFVKKQKQDNDNYQPKIGWFPKSQVSFSRRNVKTNEATAVIPVWLLDEKGWE